jgi:hypothetical protein
MGWQEARQRYRSGQTLTDQSVEDLVARRVLRGLGIPVKAVGHIEKAIFYTAYFDDALWVRTLRILRYALSTRRSECDIEVYEVGSDKDLLERLQLAGDTGTPVFLTRVKGTTQSYAYYMVPLDLVGHVYPPFAAIAVMGQRLVLKKDTEDYIIGLNLQPIFEEKLSHGDESE